MKQKSIGILLMVVTAIALSFSTLLLKYIPQLTGLTPGQTGIWRFLIAAPALWIFGFLSSSEGRRVHKGFLRYMGLGLVFSVSSFSALFSLARLPASIYIIVVYIYPSLVVLYMLITRGSVPRLYWLGLPLTMIGLLLVTFNFNASLTVDPVGILITLLNAFSLMVYMILSGKLFRSEMKKSIGTKYVLTGSLVAGLLMIPIMGLKLPGSLLGWVLVVVLGVFGTILPILSMNIGLQYLGAARGSVITTLQPVLTILLTTLFFGEILSLQQWLGGLLVVLAIILIQLSSDREAGEGKIAAEEEVDQLTSVS